MASTLTDDAVGKTVVDAEGKELGIVAAVDDGTAHVDPNPSVAEHLMARVGWEGRDQEDYVITEEMLARVGDEVVLRGDL